MALKCKLYMDMIYFQNIMVRLKYLQKLILPIFELLYIFTHLNNFILRYNDSKTNEYD